MRRIKAWQWLLIFIVLLPIIIVVILGLLPVTADPILAENEIVVGAPAKANGVKNEFPDIVVPAANPTTPEKQALGKLLFFDPVLSGDKSLACASCHQPDLGLSDGQALHTGADGKPLTRKVPSLYEVAYKSSLFWDGRAKTLEEQMIVPLTAANEMGNTPEQIVGSLKAIPEYNDLFAKAFSGQSDPITMDNVTYALAAFERSLVAHNSPYDKFAQGDFAALTASQRRGLAIFKSGAAGCYNCHSGAEFTTDKYAVTGVPDPDGAVTDIGYGAVTKKDADKYSFKIPTLRNVALHAPYMHNGRFATLEDVVVFYAKGGGNGAGVKLPNMSRLMRPFTLSEQETSDLINFLYALTDESAKPTVPDKVPSGLTLIAPTTNPAAETIAKINTGSEAKTSRPPTTLTVNPEVTIQSVVDVAQAGDTIEISYGTYHERVFIDLPNITVRGIPNANGDLPLLDGEMKFADGITATGDNFTAEKLAIKNYQGNGIIANGITGVTIRDIYVENTSLYGVYPVHSTNVLVENVTATRIRDAGIYTGQSKNVVLRNNIAYGNVIGIEIENSVDSELYGNHTYDNTTGIFVDLLPQLPSKVSMRTKLHDNIIENNNHENFANAGEIGALVPVGGGIVILGGDDVEITANTIKDNKTAGIAIFSTSTAFKPELIDVGPTPERVHIFGNKFTHNGYQADKALTDLGINGADIVWDGSNWDNRFDESGVSSFPLVLPSSGWPDFTRKAYWQVFNFVVTKLVK